VLCPCARVVVIYSVGVAASTYPFVAASVSAVGVARFVILFEPISRALLRSTCTILQAKSYLRELQRFAKNIKKVERKIKYVMEIQP